jgi:hypothetical protein
MEPILAEASAPMERADELAPRNFQRRQMTVHSSDTRNMPPLSPAPPSRQKIRFSHGGEWKALISKYIETIPVSGHASCVAEQSMSGEPLPWIPVTSAMIAKVGAAASDIPSATRNAGRVCLSPFWFI